MTRAELSGFKNAVYGQLMYILLKQEVCKEKPESSNQKENPQPKKTKNHTPSYAKKTSQFHTLVKDLPHAAEFLRGPQAMGLSSEDD